MAKQIPLIGNNGSGLFAVVDDEDYEHLTCYRWRAMKRKYGIYAIAARTRKTLLMHRLVMGEPNGKQIDHINHDGLDNRKSNLRICTGSQNQANARSLKINKGSRYKGVAFLRDTFRRKPWLAKIFVEGKQIHLGSFTTELEAALVYDKAARKYFGEFAYLNFPNWYFGFETNRSIIQQSQAA